MFQTPVAVKNKPVDFKAFANQLSNVKSADGLRSILFDLSGHVTPGPSDVRKMQVMVAERAQELLPKAFTPAEAGVLRMIVSEVQQIHPNEVRPSYTSNLGAISTDNVDHLGYQFDQSRYYSKGVSNGG
ncbi:Uncharacterised protein [uncultured archaeon]|nr:Uncharacterised protein [uncultured archaeon]